MCENVSVRTKAQAFMQSTLADGTLVHFSKINSATGLWSQLVALARTDPQEGLLSGLEKRKTEMKDVCVAFWKRCISK